MEGYVGFETYVNKLTEYHKNNLAGQFIPENNYETMIKKYMRFKTKKDLGIITNSKTSFC